MAFTRKSKPTKSAKPASYARKSKKHEEPVEEHEEQEEVESDYEDAPEPEVEPEEQEPEQEPERESRPVPSRGYSSNNYARPNQSRGQSYGAPRRNAQPQGSQDGKGVRVTGLFSGKREGLWTGRLRKEDIENLMTLFDNALNSNQLVTMFLWENQDGPQFSLTANLAQEFKGGGGGGGRFNRGYRGSIGRR
jgi:hypothetical protein